MKSFLFKLLNRRLFPGKYALEKNGILFLSLQKSSWLQKRKVINEYTQSIAVQAVTCRRQTHLMRS